MQMGDLLHFHPNKQTGHASSKKEACAPNMKTGHESCSKLKLRDEPGTVSC